jgi:hypothetical protein
VPLAAATAFAGGPHHATAKTHLTARPDSGTGGSNWANDNFWPTATVTSFGSVASTNCASLTPDTGCYAYKASLADSGKLTTIVGQLTPNQTLNPHGTFGRAVTGTMSGPGNFATFYATTEPNAALVPKNVTGATDPSSTWPTLFFSPGTVSTPSEVTFGYVYTAHVWSAGLWTTQRWADTWNNGAGGLLADGNITG